MGSVNLDKEFFQDVLRKYEKNDSISVEKFQISPAVDKGNNFASVVSRVAVNGVKMENNNVTAEYEISLIIKQLVNSKVLLEKYHFDVVFGNESAAYNTIIPTLAKCTPTGRLNTAECLLANKDIVVLKDLSQDGYKNIDKKKDFQVDEAKLTLTELAKLHAASFVLRQEDPKKLDHLGTLTQEIIFNNNDDSVLKFQGINFDVAIHVFQQLEQTPRILKAIKALEDLKENAAETQIKLITGNRKYQVMTHGDTWGNNILVNGNSVILIDLQIMRYASVAADLSYFLYINMQPSTLRQNYDALLQHYLDVLHEQMLLCGVDMRTELTAEWLRKEMGDFALLGVTSALWLLPVFHYDMSDLNFDDFTEEDFYKMDFHMDHMTDGFKDRVVELVLDYVQYNVD